MTRELHVITGMPRAGSTLLCNLLNQREDTFASSTSALAQATNGMGTLLSNSPEETSRLANVPGTDEQHKHIMRSMFENWHDTDARYVFDKGRAWTRIAVSLQNFLPDAKLLVCVRDPRDVVASNERRHRETGIYNGDDDLRAKIETQMSRTGLVGSPLVGISDLIDRKLSNVCFVKFERLVLDPRSVMSDIEDFVGMDPHSYNVNDVQNSSYDLDPLYRNKYPHDGSGKVSAPNYSWKDYFTEPVGDWILSRYPLVSEGFGYS